MGVAVSDTSIDTKMATESVTANSRNSRPTIPGISRIGMKTAISEMLMESTVNPISLRAVERGRERLHTAFDVPGDVFDHYDRVVHHEAGCDGQRHQRQVVEVVAEQVHGSEGRDQRHRHRDTGNERRPCVAQEDEDHHDHEADRNHHVPLGVLDRGANHRRAVNIDLQVDVGGREARNCGSRF